MQTCTENLKKVKITLFDKIFDVAIKFDVQTQSYFKNGSAVNSRIERTNGQMGQYSFETLIQRVNLTHNYGTKHVSNRDRKKNPCLLFKWGCETTTPDLFAYTWNFPELCVMTKILTQDAKTLH